MNITIGEAINIALITLEVGSVLALWSNFFIKQRRLAKQARTIPISLTRAYNNDPNDDLKRAKELIIRQSSTMLPIIAAFASLSVFFSDTLISYFTLLPLIISLSCYYIIFASQQPSFNFNGPREELVNTLESNKLIRYDKHRRRRLIKQFMKVHILKVLGHINFMVAIFAFLVGTIISKSAHLSTISKTFVMLHAILISYIIAFLVEALVIKNPVELKPAVTEDN